MKIASLAENLKVVHIEQVKAAAVSDMFASDYGTIKGQVAAIAESIAIEEYDLEVLDKEVSARKKTLDETRKQLAEMMIAAGVDSVKLQSGLNPKAKTKVNFFWQPGLPEDVKFGWLRENGLGGIIKETVHHGTLQSTLKDFSHQGHDLPEGLFNVQNVPSITMYGKSKFLAAREGVYSGTT